MFEQFIIAITGVTAIWLANDRNMQLRKYACLVGLAGQPFWLHATFSAEMAGLFILSVLYTVAWLKGVWNYWIKPGFGNLSQATNKPDLEQDWL